jgi:chorismate synthase
MNSFGNKFRITIFGESHSDCIGIIIDGCPPGLPIDKSDFYEDIQRRSPKNTYESQRDELDDIEILSGIFEGCSDGTPITILARNRNLDSSTYFKGRFRPGHADFVAFHKYKGFNDYRGGGMFSGRTTIGLVVAGVIAKKLTHPVEYYT